MEISLIVQVAILLLCVIVHELAHGYTALALGDPTAKYAGRLTMNPIKHLDPFGSVFLPLLLAITSAPFLIGWAKPVPFNPYNLKNQRWGELLIAIAGPLSNIALAILLAIVFRLAPVFGLSFLFLEIIYLSIVINIVLAIFNLVPIPPLDGSKIMFGLFPSFANKYRVWLEQYGFVILIFFIIFLWDKLNPLIGFILDILV